AERAARAVAARPGDPARDLRAERRPDPPRALDRGGPRLRRAVRVRLARAARDPAVPRRRAQCRGRPAIAVAAQILRLLPPLAGPRAWRARDADRGAGHGGRERNRSVHRAPADRAGVRDPRVAGDVLLGGPGA